MSRLLDAGHGEADQLQLEARCSRPVTRKRSEIAQGEGNVLEKAEQAIEGLGEGGGDVGHSSGDPSGGAER